MRNLENKLISKFNKIKNFNSLFYFIILKKNYCCSFY
jgi:hypothetical protein